jgi:hypothetical protein
MVSCCAQWRLEGARGLLAARLSAGGFGGFAVVFSVSLGGFGGVVRCVMKMAGGDLSVISGDVVIFFFVVPSGFAMMMRGLLVMLGSFVVMLACLLGHVSSSRVLESSWAVMEG